MARTSRLMGYAEIAEHLGVKVESVRIYAHNDPDFPTAATPPSLRSPGFRESDVEAYVKRRISRRRGKVGPPPRASSTPRIDDHGLGERVRAALTAPDATISTMSELAERLDVSWDAVRRRINGRTRWTEGEIATLRELFGDEISVTATNE